MKYKKLLSAIVSGTLAVTATGGVLPNAVPNIGQSVQVSAESASGTCGQNAAWELDDEGTLTISGSGAIENYEDHNGSSTAPWYSYQDKINEIIIKDGITSIGENAFHYCSSFKSMIIPNSITNMGKWAFSSCSSLEEVHISDLKAWCGIDFENATANPLCYANNLYLNENLIKELVIPNGITEIKKYAFEGCESFTNVIVPESVKSIGEEAFCDCAGLTDITIRDPECEIYVGSYTVGGDCTICNGPGETHWSYCFNGTIHGYANSTAQAYAEKYEYKFEEITDEPAITAPAVTTTVTSLTSITTATQISYKAPALVLGNAEAAPGKTVKIPVKVFGNNNFKMLDAVIKWNDTSLKASRAYAAGPASVASDAGECYCTVVAYSSGTPRDGVVATIEFTIPDDANIGDTYDLYFGSVNSFKLFDSDNIASEVQTYGGTITVKSPVVTTSAPAVTTTTETTVTTQETYRGTQYGDSGIYYEKTNWGYDGAYNFITISDCDRSLTELNIPSEIEGLPVEAIKGCIGCTKLKKVIIPDSVKRVATQFYGSELFNSQKGIKYAGKWLIGCDDSVTDAVIKDGTVGIAEYAFNETNAPNIKSITIPESMTEIQDYALCGSSAEKIIIPETVKTLGYRSLAFTDIESIDLPDSLIEIGSETFIGCTKLSNIVLGKNLEKIGRAAFTNCESIDTIKIPESVTNIGFEVFDGTPLLKNQSGVKYADNWLIGCDTDLTSVKIKDGTRGIVGDAFYDCGKITDIEIPDSVVSICYGAFGNCKGLKSVVVPKSVSFIDAYAFADCDALKDITINNPNCHICDEGQTICNKYDYSNNTVTFNGTIYSYKGSTAQAYAEKYGYKFEELKDESVVTTTSTTTTSPTTSTTVSTTVSTTAVMTTTPTEITTTVPIEQKGDANGDGKVNVRDAAHIAKMLAQGKAFMLTIDADFNGDGKVNVRDAAAIAKYLATGKK